MTLYEMVIPTNQKGNGIWVERKYTIQIDGYDNITIKSWTPKKLTNHKIKTSKFSYMFTKKTIKTIIFWLIDKNRGKERTRNRSEDINVLRSKYCTYSSRHAPLTRQHVCFRIRRLHASPDSIQCTCSLFACTFIHSGRTMNGGCGEGRQKAKQLCYFTTL